MKNIFIEKSGDGQPHWLYDLSLPLPERREQRRYFPSAKDLANYLGVMPQRIFNCSRDRHRLYSKNHEKTFAIRRA